jgi:hypothetical protein
MADDPFRDGLESVAQAGRTRCDGYGVSVEKR